MLKLSLSRMEELFSRINGERTLYAPIQIGEQTQFTPWVPDAAVQMNRLSTVKSPKDYFFPHIEDIAAFRVQGKEIEILDVRTEAAPFAVFGVRACDAESLNLLDRIFLDDPIDTFYESKRKSGLIITTACFEPEETCFCGVFGIDALSPGGDIATWIVDDTLYWNALTEKGEALTEAVKDLFEETDDMAVKAAQEKAQTVFDKLPFRDLNLDGLTGEVLMKKFNSPEWANLNPSCLSCGTCTFICPTCHCYDIQDFDTGKGIQRFKCWDSCMCSDFTLMAHGNPRTSQLERFRQRYMHKLIYFPDNNDGAYACVGCGRCVQKCPISMNIVKVIKALGVENDV
ncbi:MAG: 4Fe-4S dicluster domain-containing protein [Oscillospiraceae bacterium]|nr:4Fe-4S dicluster domain-containing protein [Oscillospiraceae bacterium]